MDSLDTLFTYFSEFNNNHAIGSYDLLYKNFLKTPVQTVHRVNRTKKEI